MQHLRSTRRDHTVLHKCTPDTQNTLAGQELISPVLRPTAKSQQEEYE